MSDTDCFTDQEIVARTLFGEARGQGVGGMHAVANVIINRVRAKVRFPSWGPANVRSVCLQPYQFSCWLPLDPNRPKLLSVTPDDPQYAAALCIAADAITGRLPDISNSGDSYERRGTNARWAQGLQPVAIVGLHLFYRTVEQPLIA